MPDEFDAFGRKKDDAGFGDLGWGASGDKPAETSVSATPTPAPVAPPARVPAGPGRNPAKLFLQLAVLAAIVAAIALAVMSGGTANQSARKTLDSYTAGPDPSGRTPITKGDDGDGKIPRQVRPASFFTAKGLRAGLRILAKEQPGRITNFSMRKDRIDVGVNRGGKSHTVELKAGAEVPDEYSVSDATPPTADTISYEELNPPAPDRLMRAANARLDTSPKQVDYFVASKAFGPLQWTIFYKNHRAAKGDSRGRFTTRLQ